MKQNSRAAKGSSVPKAAEQTPTMPPAKPSKPAKKTPKIPAPTKKTPKISAPAQKTPKIPAPAKLSNGFDKTTQKTSQTPSVPPPKKKKVEEKAAKAKPEVKETTQKSKAKAKAPAVSVKQDAPKKKGKKPKANTDDAINEGDASSEPSSSGTRKRKIEKISGLPVSDPSSPSKIARVEVSTKVAREDRSALLEVPTLPTVSGVLFGIGCNDIGQLGLGEDPPELEVPREIPFPVQLADIAAGAMHSVCLTVNGEVYTFGCNDEGALGRQTEDVEGSEYVPQRVTVHGFVVKISAGDSHSAALTDEGRFFVWGNFRNSTGSMGLISRDAKQTSPCWLLRDKVIVDIASGSEHVVCLSNEGTVYTIGCGESGQLGRVSQRNCAEGGRKGFAATFLEAQSVSVKPNLTFTNVWAGSYATFMKSARTNAIYACGLNNHFQLGFGTQAPPADVPEGEEEFAGHVEGPAPVFYPVRIPNFSTDRSWQRISGGQHHTLALDGNGKVYACGRHEYGRLGFGNDNTYKTVPTMIPTLEQKKCVDISSGNIVSFSVSETGQLYSWGMGTSYQLGHGNEDDCHVPTIVNPDPEHGSDFGTLWNTLKVSGGGQHTLILANKKITNTRK